MLRNVQSEAMGPCGFIRPIPACWDHLTRCSASLRLPPSLPLMSPYGLPSAGYPASPRWHVFATVASLLRLPTLGYTVDSPLISCAFAAVTPARETDHGACRDWRLKTKRTQARLGKFTFFESHIRATNAPACSIM
jgi:hypothetical protein